MRQAAREKFVLSLCIGKSASENILKSGGRVGYLIVQNEVFAVNHCPPLLAWGGVSKGDQKFSLKIY